MILAFLAVSIFIGMFVSYLWSSRTLGNTLIKMALSAYTIWAIILFAILIVPFIAQSSMKLI